MKAWAASKHMEDLLPWLTHMARKLVPAVGWEAAISSPMDLSSGLLEDPYNTAADFPQSSQYRREEGRHLSVLIAWTQKSCTVTSSGILGHGGQAWFHMGGDGTWL